MAGGGGNYSVFMTTYGELYVFMSYLGEEYLFGFWNVTDYILANGTAYETGQYDFIGMESRAEMYCYYSWDAPDEPVFSLFGARTDIGAAETWLDNWSQSIDVVLMDTSANDVEGVASLYNEQLSPWREYLTMRTHSADRYHETYMTWAAAQETLRVLSRS